MATAIHNRHVSTGLPNGTPASKRLSGQTCRPTIGLWSQTPKKELRWQLPARHQRVDADRHETPPVRQGPRRLGIQARVGNAGRLPRVQTGILLRLSRKAHILPRRSRRAGQSVCPRRRQFQKRRVRAVGRRPGQGLLHVLEREPRQIPSDAFFTGDPARIFRTSPTACAESRGKSTVATAFRP